jgi:DNA-binding SARP family transcriptional activator
MEFRILGPLEVSEGGRPIEVPRRKQRALLAALLLHAGEAVSAERLVQQLWGEDAPPRALGSLQNTVSQVRRLIGPDVLVTRSRSRARRSTSALSSG